MRDTMDIQKPFFDFDTFVATGGGAVSDKWLQITADTLGKQMVRTAVTEASALGAAMIAGVGNNMFASYDEAIEQMVHEQT
jgi:sugar (pentulose or hexulose) kinase